MSFNDVLKEYEKKGFTKHTKRKTKLAEWVLLLKKREGFLSFGQDGIFLYHVDGDVSLDHINDFLKRYKEIYEKKNFDSNDQGILSYSGNLKTSEFRKLARSILNDDQYKGMNIKQQKPISKSKTSIKTKRYEEEETKEKITIERETKKTIIEETEISIKTIVQTINKWKKIAPKATGRSKERQMTLSMTGYLASEFPNIRLEQKLAGTRIDAVIKKIGIEAKYRPDQNEINRLYGQVDDYLRYMDHIIVVFFDTNQAEINNFSRKIDSGGYSEKVTFINV